MSESNGMPLARAIANSETVNYETQISTMISMLNTLDTYFELSADWTNTLTLDEQNYYLATLQITSDNPQQAAVAGQMYQVYQVDSLEMDEELQTQNSMIQADESVTQTEGAALSNSYKLESPLSQIYANTSQAIQGWG